MKTIGISMMKDEGDICYWTVKHMMTQVDMVLVLDNNSSDDTAAKCREAGAIVFPDPEPAYYQSRKMTDLAKKARLEYGAEWIVPFDADELWYTAFGIPIKELLIDISPPWSIVEALLYNHFSTAQDADEPNPFKRMKWRMKEPGKLPKVACRWAEDLVIQQGNHGASYMHEQRTKQNFLIVRHFPYRSPEQFIRKIKNGAAAYKLAAELDEDTGAHWRGYGKMLEEKGEVEVIKSVYQTWFYSEDPKGDYRFIFDPAPLEGAE